MLVADEPVSALDVSVQATILALFDELRERLGLAILLISHNLAVVRHLSDRVAVMYLGSIVETAPRDALFGDPRSPYTQVLLKSAPRLSQIGRTPQAPLKGDPPSAIDIPSGWRFHAVSPRGGGLRGGGSPAAERERLRCRRAVGWRWRARSPRRLSLPRRALARLSRPRQDLSEALRDARMPEGRETAEKHPRHGARPPFDGVVIRASASPEARLRRRVAGSSVEDRLEPRTPAMAEPLSSVNSQEAPAGRLWNRVTTIPSGSLRRRVR